MTSAIKCCRKAALVRLLCCKGRTQFMCRTHKQEFRSVNLLHMPGLIFKDKVASSHSTVCNKPCCLAEAAL